MTREEIREGIEKELELALIRNCPSGSGGLYQMRFDEKGFIKDIISYLNGKVVIRVNRELPEVPITSNSSAKEVPPYSQGYAQCKQDMAGYVAVEPLVEDV